MVKHFICWSIKIDRTMWYLICYVLGLPHTDTHSNDDMEIKPVNPIDGLETRSQSSMSEDLPVDASSTPTPPTVRNSALNIPDSGTLSSLGGKLHLSRLLEYINVYELFEFKMIQKAPEKNRTNQKPTNFSNLCLLFTKFSHRSSSCRCPFKWWLGNQAGHCRNDTRRRAGKFETVSVSPLLLLLLLLYFYAFLSESELCAVLFAIY